MLAILTRSSRNLKSHSLSSTEQYCNICKSFLRYRTYEANACFENDQACSVIFLPVLPSGAHRPEADLPNPLRSLDSLPHTKKLPPAPVIVSQPHDFNIPNLAGTDCPDSSAGPQSLHSATVRRRLTSTLRCPARHTGRPWLLANGSRSGGRALHRSCTDQGRSSRTVHAECTTATLVSRVPDDLHPFLPRPRAYSFTCCIITESIFGLSHSYVADRT